MRVQVLGCSGGIGGGRHTTALLVDDDVLIDAGSGVLELETEQLSNIDHIFLTHAHLDHILSLPLMLDSVGYLRDTPIVVHATEAVIQTLRCNIFNWCIWPDFCRIPSVDHPYLLMRPLELGDSFELPGNRRIRPLPADHVVPAVGYELAVPQAKLVFTGDTTYCREFWDEVNRIENLRYMIIETAFGEEERGIAEVSKHLSPGSLMAALAHYKGDAEICITHLKPGQETRIMGQIEGLPGNPSPVQLQQGRVFSL